MSPYESDAQITFLVNNGFADLAITEDSDLLAYGCREVCLCFTLQLQALMPLESTPIVTHLVTVFQEFQNRNQIFLYVV